MKLAVLGSGAWGTALALLLSQHEVDVHLWAHHVSVADKIQADHQNQRYLPGMIFPDNIHVSANLQSCLDGAEGVMIAVPSHAFREVLTNALPYLSETTYLAWASKGLDSTTHALLSTVASELRGENSSFAILAGPSFAKEVAEGKPTAVTLAHNNEACAEFWQRYLHTRTFRVYTTQDYIGAQLAGAVKNVLAIATGVADGLGLGANTQAALITRGLNEMMRLGMAMGAQTETFMGLAGMGDLILTCTDNQSRNRRFGYLLGQGKTIMQAMDEIDQVVEGLGTTKLVHELSKARGIEMPITEQVYQVLYQKQSPQKAVEALLSRVAKIE
jgi:glycerol-3-phosphate dehydrogenase (NAD(P)+)